MKTKLCLILFLLCFGKAFAQFSDYRVRLWIYEFEDSTLYIRGAYGEKSSLMLDTLEMQKDGSFLLEGNFHSGIVVASSEKEDMFSFLLDKEKEFTISIFPDGFYEVKGSIENDRYLEYQKMNREYRMTLTTCNALMNQMPESRDSIASVMTEAKKRFSDFQQSFYKSYPENLMSVLVRAVSAPKIDKGYVDASGQVIRGKEAEYAYIYRSEYWKDFDFKDARIMGTPYFYKKFQTYIDKLTMQNADSVFASFKFFVDYANQRGGELYSDYTIDLYLNRLSRLPFSFNEILYTKIVDSLLNDRYTPWLSEDETEFHRENVRRIRPFLPGNAFPNISAQTLEGKKLDLYDLKHRYTVVFFWSAGCESCKKNIEELQEFYKAKKKEYDFEVYSIEMGGDSEETHKALEQTPLDWIVVQSDPTQIEKLYSLNVEHTPEIYILDRGKRILNKTALSSHIKAVIEQDRVQ